MGRIANVVKRFTAQKCVYWGNPVDNRKGGWTYDAPAEIDCRWDEKQEFIVGFDGNKYSSQATILVNIDLDRQGYMWLGTLAELNAVATDKGYDINKPIEFPDAFIIIQFAKIPAPRKDDDFARIAYLYDQG